LSSRLFHAVVGVGIALGTSAIGCSGAIDVESAAPDGAVVPDLAHEDSGTSPDATKINSAHDAGADSNHDSELDAGIDATTGVDAALDAPQDVILDAFCDAAWPTTKGNPNPPTCGAVVDCADAGEAPFCYVALSSTQCDGNQLVPAWCVGGDWQCSPGSTAQKDCVCWMFGPDAGQLADGGACP
jgi:hypothetical protein